MISTKSFTLEKILHRLGKIIVKIYAFFMYDMDVIHISTLPSGPKIFIANHPGTLDPFILSSMGREKTNVLVRGELFKIPVFGTYLYKSGHIPVLQNQGEQIIDAAVTKLKKGENVLVFIEGELSPTKGGFSSPRTGAARIALKSGAPIIPVGIGLFKKKLKKMTTNVDGSTEIAWIYPYGRLSFTFGGPIKLHGDVDNRDFVQNSSQQLMCQIRQLSYLSLERLTS